MYNICVNYVLYVFVLQRQDGAIELDVNMNTSTDDVNGEDIAPPAPPPMVRIDTNPSI